MEGDCGVGIGSQISQNAGIFYPTPLDQYFKTVRGEKFYAAYMDDRYLICRTKEHAKECLEDMRRLVAELGLVINEKKTQIIKLSRGFTFLKVRYVLTETGKVVKYQKEGHIRQRAKKTQTIQRYSDGSGSGRILLPIMARIREGIPEQLLPH